MFVLFFYLFFFLTLCGKNNSSHLYPKEFIPVSKNTSTNIYSPHGDILYPEAHILKPGYTF